MPQHVMPLPSPESAKAFHALDAFTQGYIQAAFFTECHCDNPELENMTFDDLDPRTLSRFISDSLAFQAKNAETLADAYAQPGYDAERAGHDFWFTRNGHGAGFWDGDLPELLGDRLTLAAKAFCQIDLYATDDGKLAA